MFHAQMYSPSGVWGMSGGVGVMEWGTEGLEIMKSQVNSFLWSGLSLDKECIACRNGEFKKLWRVRPKCNADLDCIWPRNQFQFLSWSCDVAWVHWMRAWHGPDPFANRMQFEVVRQLHSNSYLHHDRKTRLSQVWETKTKAYEHL